MARPLRIEYENAYYHVMNRGRDHQLIFYGEDYYAAFLKCLFEAHERFGIEILCYCLMGNHYHLLIKTPQGNLTRAMRHIGGVYTQRYNRLKKSDGALFRGRYKAILVEEDSYQLQLSRYIHRNPVDANIIKDIADYPWSSYPSYVNKVASQKWLNRNELLKQFNHQANRYTGYQSFVEQGVDEELVQFYGKKNMMAVLGSDSFREWAYSIKSDDEEITRKSRQIPNLPVRTIVIAVAEKFEATEDSILKATRGRGQKNIPRWVAMYICQEKGGYKLAEIAKYFGLARYATVSTTISRLKIWMEEDKRTKKMVNQTISALNV